MSAEKKTLFTAPGQHEHEGVMYLSITPGSLFDRLGQFEMDQEDVLFSTYPSSCTAFLSDVLYLIHNEADVEKVKTVPHGILVPFLDHMLPKYDPIVELAKAPKPRLLKVHLPPTHLQAQIDEGKVKVVVMLRNPKDNLAAYYDFYRMKPGPLRYEGSFGDFFEIFKAKQLFVGDWFDHALGWWNLRERDNVLVLKFEDVKADPEKYVRQVAQFCQQPELAPEVSSRIASYIRDGEAREEIEIGGWKKVFSDEQNEYFDKLVEENLAGTGLTFDNMDK